MTDCRLCPELITVRFCSHQARMQIPRAGATEPEAVSMYGAFRQPMRNKVDAEFRVFRFYSGPSIRLKVSSVHSTR
jgi:hypothetical protein